VADKSWIEPIEGTAPAAASGTIIIGNATPPADEAAPPPPDADPCWLAWLEP
jgi:hypothetical protein